MKTELERLESLGIIIPVQHSNWAAPVVRVLKANGTIRLCGDYRVEVDKVDGYIGIINYYARFLSILSTKLTPLYILLQKESK